MEFTEQKFVEVCREHRLTVARRVSSEVKALIGQDAKFKIPEDCSQADAILYAKVMQQRLREVLESMEDIMKFAER